MTIKELKQAIAGLPDEADVVVSVNHSKYDWEDEVADNLETEYISKMERLHINANIEDE